MASHTKTLSEKISELINPNPVWEDPENEYTDTTAKVVENAGEYIDDEILPRSTLKLSHCALLDEEDNKYLAKKVSRKKIENGSFNVSDLSRDAEEHELSDDESTSSKTSSESVISEDGESGSEYEGAGSDDASIHEQNLKSLEHDQDHHIEDDSFKHIISDNLSAELERGNAVRSQIRLWDNLLEARIQMQKCLVAANRLPQYDSLNSFKKLGESEFQMQLNLCKKEGFGFLEKLMDLQRKLLLSNSETRKLCSGKPRDAENNDEIISDDEEGIDLTNLNGDSEIPTKRRKLSDCSAVIAQQHNDFKQYRNDTLEKWYNRSKVSVASKKSSNFSAFDLSVLKQIEHMLCDQDNLIKRTQKRRSSYRVLGHPAKTTEVKKDQESKDEEEFDKEIYDDDDFYHKLLRELIERKTADVTDPVQLGRQWTELQKLRRKLKKKVDTRASKGRKIRYVVHSKLVNYMAPIPNNWSDSAMDDLFRSLFGKTE